MSATVTVVTTLVIYQVVLLAIGYWARSRASSSSGYFIGDRSLGPYVAALSYAAGSSSAWSILGVSGIAFSQGLSAFWLIPGTIAGHIVVWFVIAPQLQRRSHAGQWVTLTDLLAENLPPLPRLVVYRVSAFVILFCFTFYVAAQFQGAANTFTSTFDFDFLTALLMGAAVVLIYTFWGGFWAVSITDALQAVLMLLAALILPIVALQAIGGLDGLLAQGDATQYWSFLPAQAQPGWFGVGFVLGMVSIGFGPIGQPHLLNRIMALRAPSDLNRARIVVLVWFVVVLCGMFVLGICGHALAVSSQGEMVFFDLAQNLLPPVLTGVLIAAVLSAIMSTADSQLLVAGAAVQHDLKGGEAPTGGNVLAGRLAVLSVAVAAIVLAVVLPESIFSRVLFAWNALGAAFGPIVVARIMGWQGQPWAIPSALITGFGLTVLFYSLPDGPGDLWERAVPFVAAALLLWLLRGKR